MGQQTNKVQKRRRRLAYLERKKTKAKAANLPKPKPRRATKKAAVAAPVAPSE